jgi:hypothetical protein
MESLDPTSGLLEHNYEKVQDKTIIVEILGLASMEENDHEEEIPNKDSLDKHYGFQVDYSIQRRRRNRSQELCGEGGAEARAIQRRADTKEIALIGSEQITKSDRQCNWPQEDTNVPGRKFGECASNIGGPKVMTSPTYLHHFLFDFGSRWFI